MMARMSSVFRILYSLPSSLISVPPYLETSTRSPFLTSKGTFLPLSSVLPVPTAMMMPSCGFSLAVSGMMMPPFLISFSSAGSTRTRSPRGLRLVLAIVRFCFRFGLFRFRFRFESTPAAPRGGKSVLVFGLSVRAGRSQAAGQRLKFRHRLAEHRIDGAHQVLFHVLGQRRQVAVVEVAQRPQRDVRVELAGIHGVSGA